MLGDDDSRQISMFQNPGSPPLLVPEGHYIGTIQEAEYFLSPRGYACPKVLVRFQDNDEEVRRVFHYVNKLEFRQLMLVNFPDIFRPHDEAKFQNPQYVGLLKGLRIRFRVQHEVHEMTSMKCAILGGYNGEE